MSIASQPLPGAVAVEEHNDVDHTSVSLAVSTVILALRPKDNETHPTLWLPLVRRLREPYKGQWALPGGPLNPNLSLEEAAASTLKRATNLQPGYLEQLYAFGDVLRTPEARAARVVGEPEPAPGTDHERRGVRGVLGVDSRHRGREHSRAREHPLVPGR